MGKGSFYPNTPEDIIPSDNYLSSAIITPLEESLGAPPESLYSPTFSSILCPPVCFHCQKPETIPLCQRMDLRRPELLASAHTGTAWELTCQHWQPPLPRSELQRKDSCSSASWSCMTALRCSCSVFWSSPHDQVQVFLSCSTSFSTWPHFSTVLPVFLVTLPHKSLSHDPYFRIYS